MKPWLTEHCDRKFCAATLGVVLGFCAMLQAGGSWAALSARLDRTVIQDGGTATLTIESDGASAGEPDLSPLRKDFEVLGTTSGTQFSIVNGLRSDLRRWVVQLQPRRVGTISVPSIAVGNERTAPLEIKVAQDAPQTGEGGEKHAIVEAELGVNTQSIYVQQQIPYTVRLYYDDAVESGQLEDPHLDHAIVEKLGDDKHYTGVRDGHEYKVVERNYVVAPEQSGSLRIPAVTFRGRIAAPSNGATGRDPLDSLLAQALRDSPFANNRVFGSGLLGGSPFGDTQPLAARSQEFTLGVKPRPASATGNWLPAEQVALIDSWANNPPQFKAGEPVTRTITVSIKGLAASQIPALKVAQPDHARIYTEPAEGDSRTDGQMVYGTSKQSVTYIPDQAGEMTIPAIELDWWNTRTDSASRSTVAAHRFTVLPGVAGTSNPATAPVPAAAPGRAASTGATAVARPVTGSWMRSLLGAIGTHAAWFVAAMLALVLIVVLLARWMRSYRRGHLPVDAAIAAPPKLKPAMHSLRQACAANDAHAAEQTLLLVGRAQWPRNPPVSLRALADQVEGGRDQINALARSLYSAGAPAWNGAALWGAFRPGPTIVHNFTWAADDGLEALYR